MVVSSAEYETRLICFLVAALLGVVVGESIGAVAIGMVSEPAFHDMVANMLGDVDEVLVVILHV